MTCKIIGVNSVSKYISNYKASAGPSTYCVVVDGTDPTKGAQVWINELSEEDNPELASEISAVVLADYFGDST